jgi:predicted nuclease of predicted toxin-antitoxin system
MAAKRSRSKRRSGTSAQPDLPLFLDRALDSDLIYEALAAAGAIVFRHRNCFADNAIDPDWLPVVGHQGWVVLTKDEAMQHNEIEKIAITNSRVRVFILVRGNLSGAEMASVFVKALPAMSRIIQSQEPPFIARVYKDGKVSKTDIV